MMSYKYHINIRPFSSVVIESVHVVLLKSRTS